MKKDKSIYIIGIILAFALAVRMWVYTPHVPFWDASVYVLMGKYIFSAGAVGLIEPFRPLCWPLILGAVWKLGLDPIVWGRGLTVFFSLGSIFLTYLIGKKVYGLKAGLLGAVFLSVSPIFVFWGNHVYTGIPSTFFGLLSVYLFLRRHYMLSGIIGALGFFTRFLQAIPVAIMICVHVIGADKKNWKHAFLFVIAFVLMTIPFLLFNYVTFGHVLYPFMEGKEIYAQVRYSWAEGMILCVQKLFGKESFFFVFVPVSVFYFLKKDAHNREKWILTLLAVAMFLWVTKLQSDVLRFLLCALPYLYLVAADGVVQFYIFLKNKNIGLRVLLIVGVLGLGGRQLQQLNTMFFPENKLNVFQEYVINHPNAMRGNVWTSDPITLVYSDIKPAELMYYPVFDANRIAELNEKLFDADIIFFDAPTLACRPVTDAACLEARQKFIERIRASYKAEILEEEANSELIRGVFVRVRG